MVASQALHRASFRTANGNSIGTPSTTIGTGYDVLDLSDADLIRYDPNGMFNLANNSITVVQDGDYKIDWSVAVAAADNVVLIVDGVDTVWARGEGAGDTAVVNVILPLTAGQTIEFGSDDTIGDHSRMSMSIEQLPTSSVVDPGSIPVDDQTASGYFDIGTQRVVFGKATTSGGSGGTPGSITLTYPAPFAAAPISVNLTCGVTNNPMVATYHTETAADLVVETWKADDRTGSNVSFSYYIVGLKP